MDSERTYGVELEFACSLSKSELVDRINSAFQEAGFPEERAVSNSHDSSKWVVKSDGSIRLELGFPNQIEINSRILKGDDDLRKLEIVCQCLQGIAKVNDSCGLHVHHGIRAGENPLAALIAWMRAENTIYQCLPASRKYGRQSDGKKYARMLTAKTAGRIPTMRISNLRNYWRQNLQGRYFGFNLESYWIRSTIEIRAAAGTVEFEKIWRWADITQRLINKAFSNGPHTFSEGLDNLCLALSNETQFQVREIQRQATAVVQSGDTGWVPKFGTRYRWIYDQLAGNQGMLRRDILANRMNLELNIRPSTCRLYLTDFISEARRQGLNIRANRQRIMIDPEAPIGTPAPAPEIQVIPLNQPDINNDAALVWLKERFVAMADGHRARQAAGGRA